MATLLIHGGAGRIREDRRAAYEAGLAAALDAGFAALEAGGDATDAVTAAVRRMEDDPHAFNAGTGSAPTSAGTVECDAAVMRSDGAAGAVACVAHVRNPVTLARRILEESNHVLLVGPGAEAWEPAPVANETLLTDAARADLERWRARGGDPEASATCGAVALDDAGRLAAATSTGGVLGQHPGRVGDAPIPGAGTWADERVAVSCTGKGEAFLTTAAGRALACDLAADVPPDDAVRARLAAVRAAGGEGGLIALQRDGTVVHGFDTPQMAFAWRRDGPDGREEACAVGQDGAVVVRP